MAEKLHTRAEFWFGKARRALRGPALLMAVASFFGLALAANGLGYGLVACCITVGAFLAADAYADYQAQRARAEEARFILGLLLRTGHTSITIEKIEPKEQAHG